MMIADCRNEVKIYRKKFSLYARNCNGFYLAGFAAYQLNYSGNQRADVRQLAPVAPDSVLFAPIGK
jgi:hypothetical protein